MRPTALLIPLLVACSGTRQNDFIVDYEVAFCTAYVACASDEMLRTVGERECHAYLRAAAYPPPPDCLYDAEAAAICLADLATLAGGGSLEDTDVGAEEGAGIEGQCADVDPAMPVTCDRVYSGCPLPRLPPGAR